MNLRCWREPNSRGPTSGLKTILRPTSRTVHPCTIGNAGSIDTVRERQVAPFWTSTALKVTLILTPFHVARGTVPINRAFRCHSQAANLGAQHRTGPSQHDGKVHQSRQGDDRLARSRHRQKEWRIRASPGRSKASTKRCAALMCTEMMLALTAPRNPMIQYCSAVSQKFIRSCARIVRRSSSLAHQLARESVGCTRPVSVSAT